MIELFELKDWFGSHVLAHVIGMFELRARSGLTGRELSGPRSGPIRPHDGSPAQRPNTALRRGTDFSLSAESLCPEESVDADGLGKLNRSRPVRLELAPEAIENIG